MHVDQTTMLISREPCREALRDMLQSCARRKTEIRYLESREAAYCRTTNLIAVFTRPLQGRANLEIDIHWHGNTLIGDDAVAFRLSRLIEDEVILRNYDNDPTRWLLVAADSDELFRHAAVDETKLESAIVDLIMI